MSFARDNIARRFDRAADGYDQAASVQAQIAAQLVQKAIQSFSNPPRAILDIGSGTGFVAEAAAAHWPQAQITAIDGAPSMLKQAQQKVPHLQVIEGDVAQREFDPVFDLVLSSMVLHWLPKPREALDHWRGWLKPKGKLFTALLIEGSFQEWRDLCAADELDDGVWPFPSAEIYDGFATEQQMLRIEYPTVRDFLKRLKTTGASMPRRDHKPFSVARMRRLLKRAPKPFPVSYNVLYIEAPKSTSI